MNSTIQFEGFESLSEPEKKVFALFKNHEKDTLWSLAIRNVVRQPDVVRFRRLVAQLKSQNSDNPEVMKNILGESYEAVIAL